MRFTPVLRHTSAVRVAACSLAALAFSSGARTAHANGYEVLANGTEQISRGGAWLARATDPLATYYNPAALSRNGSGASVTVNLFSQHTCFERKGPGNTDVDIGGRQTYGKTCNEAGLFPNPQLAFQYRLTEKLGIGIAVMGPSAVGKADYPITASNTSTFSRTVGQAVDGPSGSRYLLTSLDAKIIWPQIAIGYEIAPKLRVGASFIWGIAVLKFGNVSMGLHDEHTLDNGKLREDAKKDLQASLEAKDLFVPGLVLSSMYTVGDNLDIAGWFHWSDSVKAKGQAEIAGFLYENNLSESKNLTPNKTPNNQAEVTAPQPMEARLGVRYYKPREGVALSQQGGLLKDPIRDEVFDIELDGEWAHDSQFDTLGVRFNGPPTPIIPTGSQTPLANVPVNADVPHKWKDSFGLRLGGDYVVIPNQFSVRAGSWFQTSSMRADYLHVDFVATQRLGLTLGGTFRVGPVDIQAGYGHVFYRALDNNGYGSIKALSGSGADNRSDYAVNSGRLSSSLNVFSLGVVYRFGAPVAL